MNNEFDNDLLKQDKISKLYQSLKVEQPSPQVDQNILAQARLQLKTQTEQPTVTSVKPIKTASNWRQWQWPVSVAASVLSVSVIFIGQYEFFTADQQVYPEAVPVKIEAFSPPRSTQSMADTASTMAPDAENEQSAQQVVGEQQTKAQQQRELRAAKQKSQKIELIRVEAQKFAVQQRAAQQMKMAPAPVEDLLQLIDAQITELQHQLKAKLVLLAASNKKQSNLFADKSLAQLSETNSSLTDAEQQELEQQISELQTRLFKQMQIKHNNQSDWQAPQPLLDLLTAQQQAQWVKQANKVKDGKANEDNEANEDKKESIE